MIELPGVVEGGMSERNVQRKPGTARGPPRRSRSSEGIAYKPPCGEMDRATTSGLSPACTLRTARMRISSSVV